jgi:hypothetical protein
MIRISEVVAIIDVNTNKASDPSCSFIELAKKEGQVEQISADEIKSFVITKQKVYGSPISSLTLMKRAEQSQNHQKL